MKKYTLLLLCAILGLATASAGNVKEKEADNTPQLFFGYDNGVIKDGVGAYAGYTLTALIEIPAENSQAWIGNRVVGIKIGLGDTKITEASIMLTKERSDKAPIRIKTTTVQSDWNTIMFDQPWVIDGEKFYAGYQVKPINEIEKPIGTDGRKSDGQQLGGHIGVSNSWSNVTSQNGNLCIQVIIEGDNLPQNDIALSNLANCNYYKVNETFDLTATIANKGINPVSAVVVECTVEGKPISEGSCSLTPATLQPGQEGTLKIEGLKYSEETPMSDLVVKVTKVNGQEDFSPKDNIVNGRCAFASELYPRAFVMEEWTGTWCQYCPLGIITMEYMKKTYDNFIGIAVHGGASNEPMLPESSELLYFLDTYAVNSYPGCLINRNMNKLSPEKNIIEELYKTEGTLSTVFDLQAEVIYDKDIDENQATVNTVLTSSIDIPQCRYAIALAIIEDEVGPYVQSNEFSNKKGDYDGWENKSGYVTMNFNDVARDIDCWRGVDGSVPNKLEKMQPTYYTGKVSVKNVSAIRNSSVVALLIDSQTGEILTGRKVAVIEDSLDQSSISDPSLAGYDIRIENGFITVSGDFRICDIYSIDGRHVTSVNPDQSAALDGGVYVITVITNDGTTISHKYIIQ